MAGQLLQRTAGLESEPWAGLGPAACPAPDQSASWPLPAGKLVTFGL